MKIILVIFMLVLPRFVFAQSIDEKYSIYSDYLKIFNKEKGGNNIFVIKVSTDYGRKDSDIPSILDDLRRANKGDKDALSNLYFPFGAALLDSIKKDTSWLPLISGLVQSMKHEYYIKNRFAHGLNVYLLPYPEYTKYFDKSNSNDIDEGWVSFHENYPGRSILVDLSEIISDGKRAVFYYSWHCSSLCGYGCLVFLSHDAHGWHFVKEAILWQS